MFDFEKLEVYRKAKQFNNDVQTFLRHTKVGTVSKNQLQRASLSIVLNIAEGTSRFSKADKRHFYIISRGSTFECVAIFDVLRDQTLMDADHFNQFYGKADELSRMLFKLIGSLSMN